MSEPDIVEAGLTDLFNKMIEALPHLELRLAEAQRDFDWARGQISAATVLLSPRLFPHPQAKEGAE
jgi:hypothetical protein